MKLGEVLLFLGPSGVKLTTKQECGQKRPHLQIFHSHFLLFFCCTLDRLREKSYGFLIVYIHLVMIANFFCIVNKFVMSNSCTIRPMPAASLEQ